MNFIQPIQMIGTQRSGSNLLRLLLNQYKEVVAPHPPHILQRFFPLLPAYGDLANKENMASLIEDVCRLIERNPVPWNGIAFDRQAIQEECKNNTLIDIFRVVYDKMAISHQASMWLCKSMTNVYFASEMEKEGLKPLYIYLFRDGRDVACSFKKAIVGEKHVYHIAKDWRENQLACLELKKRTAAERFIESRYEDLIDAPEKEMIRLSEFLHVKYDQAILNYYNSEESKNTSTAGIMWGNVVKPIMTNNKRKFLGELTHQEIVLFESVAGDVLELLGYELEFPEESAKLVISEELRTEFDIQNKMLKEKANLWADPEGMKLRVRQDELMKNIKKRII
ncbi:MAG: sulfotransferase [Prolixibacteraceae bacterium]|nr:sulfotransferase [Prolixibacteraceae bacterium]